MIKKTLLALPLFFNLSMANSFLPVLQLAYDVGGDELVTIQHDYELDYTIKAGDGLSFEAGMAIDNPMSNLEFQFLVGYKTDSDSAYNGEIEWSSIPLTALALVKSYGWKFGGGITYHLNPELDGGFGSDTINYNFDNAIGVVAQIQYSPIDTFAIGLRATFIEYELKNRPSDRADGTSIGVVGTFKFGEESSHYQ